MKIGIEQREYNPSPRLQLGFTFFAFLAAIALYTCGSGPPPKPSPIPAPPIIAAPTCSQKVTIRAVNDLAGGTVQLSTSPAICACSDKIVRICP